MANQQQTFKEHLQELSRRLMWPAGLFVVGMAGGFIWFKPLSRLLIKPLGETLYYTSPTGGLSYMMFISLVLGMAIALPVLVYQIVQFIRPVHHKITTGSAVKIMTASLVMAALGVVYAYTISMPSALKFLTEIGGGEVQAWITANDYISFLSAYLLGSAAIFQLPVILFSIDHIRPIPPGGLKKAQRPVILASFIVGAMLTPTPDPYNQLMIAGPMLLLFEISCALIVLRRLRRQPKTVPSAAPALVETQPTFVPRPVVHAAIADSSAFMPAPLLVSAELIGATHSGYTHSDLSRSVEPAPLEKPAAQTRPGCGLILDIRTQYPA